MKKRDLVIIVKNTLTGDDSKYCLKYRNMLHIPIPADEFYFCNVLHYIDEIIKNPKVTEKVEVVTLPLMQFVDEYNRLREKYNIYICGNDFVFPYLYTFFETEPTYKNDITFIEDSSTRLQKIGYTTQICGKEIFFEVINLPEFIIYRLIKNEFL